MLTKKNGGARLLWGCGICRRTRAGVLVGAIASCSAAWLCFLVLVVMCVCLPNQCSFHAGFPMLADSVSNSGSQTTTQRQLGAKSGSSISDIDTNKTWGGKHNKWITVVSPPAAELVKPYHVRNVTSQLGQSVFLHCIVENVGSDRLVTWIRQRDFQILTVGTDRYISDERFQTSHMQYANNWALQVKHVQLNDAGLYECSLNSDPPKSQYVALSIVVPTARIIQGRDLHVESGSTINITCIIGGSPEPPAFVFWYHDGKMINYEKERTILLSLAKSSITPDTSVSRLVINDVSPSRDSGNYTCAPANAKSVSILVHVIESERQLAAVQNEASNAAMPGQTIVSLRLKFIALLALFFYSSVLPSRVIL